MGFRLNDLPDGHFEQLNVFFEKGFGNTQLLEQSQHIDLPFVDIHSNEWYFDGIRIGYSDMHYKTPVEMPWNYRIKAELVTFHANLKGSVFTTGQNTAHNLFSNYQHNLYYANGDDVNEGFIRPHELRNTMFFIQFTKDTFLRLTQNANPALNRFNENIHKGNPAVLSTANLAMDGTMVNLIRSIVNCSYKEGLKKMYLLSKSIEFLVLQAEACQSSNSPAYKYVKTRQDQESILYAREYISRNLESPPGLSELAKIIGINEYKLKRGFKEMFNTTVFGYLSDARLDLARNDLRDGTKMITEIASSLGYSSVQHFSAAFKKKFGVAPTKLKK